MIMRNGPTGPARRTRQAIDPDFIAIQALTFIASNPDHAERFLALSGIGFGDLRQAAADPGFLLGVMDHVVSDEPLLLLVAAEAGVAPEAVVEAHDRMTRR
jgi:hypothetical protein